MSTKRAAGEAGMKALRLLAVAVIVVVIGVVLFREARPPNMPEWLWHLRQAQASLKVS
jgi:hypothetical protein